MIKAYALAIVASVALGGGALYIGNAEKNRALVKLLESREQLHVATITHQDEQIRALNGRIAENNARWLELLQKEQKRLNKAYAEAERIKAERDTITQALADSKRDWQESLANDPELYAFSRLDVPGAVFDRMRHAAGQ